MQVHEGAITSRSITSSENRPMLYNGHVSSMLNHNLKGIVYHLSNSNLKQYFSYLQYIVKQIDTFNRRHDFGNPTNECQMCGAIMWSEERSSQGRRNGFYLFNQCCRDGFVTLPLLLDAPPPLDYLLKCDGDSHNISFKKSIRAYNSLLSFTSMRANVDHLLLQAGRGLYTFRIHGQSDHLIGSLIPENGQHPKFLQLYIYDTDHEALNRIGTLDRQRDSGGINEKVLTKLQGMLNQFNQYSQMCRRVRDTCGHTPPTELTMRILDTRALDGRQYNWPTTNEVVALLVGSIASQGSHRDIVLHTISGQLQRINETHPSYMASQYPLLFPFGED